MKPNHAPREIISSGVEASQAFGISRHDEAHIMGILRDTLYSDKVLAIMREYSANAWDSHREAGKADVPIKVVLPTALEPTLTIQDFGVGLSPEAVFEVYTQYGASTKRNDNNSVGMLGIGSKSGFAYSDSFTITSRYGGKIRTYVAVLDESEKGFINLLGEDDCDLNETGVTIQIPVRTEDIPEFQTKAKNLFQFFDPRPDINIDLPKASDSEMRLSQGRISTLRGTWTAVMGCVPYRLNLDQVMKVETEEGTLGEYLRNLSGVLYFKIGEVQINASREELKYSQITKVTIVKKFHALIEEYIQTTVKAIQEGNFTYWEKRLRAQVLSEMKLPIPKEWEDLTSDQLRLHGDPKTFALVKHKHGNIVNVRVSEATRLIIKDESRDLRGYPLTADDYLIIPLLLDTPIEDVEKELAELIEATGLTGIPVEKLSGMFWTQPEEPASSKRKSSRPADPKHRVRTFVLKPPELGYHFNFNKRSENWEVEVREPQDTDVFVVLESFSPIGENNSFYDFYKRDLKLAHAYGNGKMPKVYGYKSTAKKKVDPATLKGTSYVKWREAWVKTLVTPRIAKLIDLHEWMNVFGAHQLSQNFIDNSVPKKVTEILGPDHDITKIIRKMRLGKRYVSGDTLFHKKLGTLKERVYGKDYKNNAGEIIKGIISKYPLLSIPGIGITSLWGPSGEKWAEYVKLVDASTPKQVEPAAQNGDME